MYHNYPMNSCVKYSLVYIHDKPFTINWCYTIVHVDDVILYIMILFSDEYHNSCVDWINEFVSFSYFMSKVFIKIKNNIIIVKTLNIKYKFL